MKLKNGYNIIPHNDGFLITFNGATLEKPVTLSAIGAFLWFKTIEQDLTNSQMLDLLLQEFEISTVLALGEIDTFIKTMKENEIAE